MGPSTDRLGVWRDLSGVYDQDELKAARRLGKDTRNIAAHGADGVLGEP